MQVKRDPDWEAELDRELELRWQGYRARKSYRWATAWVFAGLVFAMWLTYWGARIVLHR